MENLNLLIFSLMTCTGGMSYGFYQVELSNSNLQSIFPEQWSLNQEKTGKNIISMLDYIFSFGAFIGTIFSIYFTYKYGRILSIIFIDSFIIIFTVITISFENFEIFFILKFVKGLYIGVSYPLLLIILKEVLETQDNIDKYVKIYQISNAFGVFLPNIIFYISKKWQILIAIPIIFPIFRMIYYINLYKKGFETRIFKKYKRLRKLKIVNNSEKEEDTFLREDFTIGNLFGPKLIFKMIFCSLSVFLNFSTGIIKILKSENNGKGIIITSANFIGALCLLIPLPKPYLLKNIYLYIACFLILFCFSGVNTFTDKHDEENLILNVIFVIIFQFGLTNYVFTMMVTFMPDIGVFILITLDWIFLTLGQKDMVNFVCAIIFFIIFIYIYLKKTKKYFDNLYNYEIIN